MNVFLCRKDTVLISYAVTAEHVARAACDAERLHAGVALDERNHFGGGALLVLQPTHRQAALQPERDLQSISIKQMSRILLKTADARAWVRECTLHWDECVST